MADKGKGKGGKRKKASSVMKLPSYMMDMHEHALTVLTEDEFKKFVDTFSSKERKEGVSWITWLFLGLIGGHKFYLGNKTLGLVYLVATGLAAIGFFGGVDALQYAIVISGLGWLYDLFTLRNQIKATNIQMAEDMLNDATRM